MRVQRIGLEHHRHIALFRAQMIHRATADLHRASVLSLQPRNHPQYGGFAATRGPHQRQKLAIPDRQGHIVQHAGCAEGLGNTGKRQISQGGPLVQNIIVSGHMRVPGWVNGDSVLGPCGLAS